jgi:hypothetical protein
MLAQPSCCSSFRERKLAEIGTVLSSSTRVHRPSAAVRGRCARRSKNAAIDDKLCSLDVSCLIRHPFVSRYQNQIVATSHEVGQTGVAKPVCRDCNVCLFAQACES